MTDPVLTGALAVVDADALAHNLRQVRRLSPLSRVLAVVKADAYGHGLLAAARALADADGFAVARLSEALRLREAGFTQRAVLLCGVMSAEELELCRANAIDVVVHTPQHIDIIEQAPAGPLLDAWLKLDSGMHRLGFSPRDLPEAFRRLRSAAAVVAPPRILTHLADADRPDLAITAEQVRCTHECSAGLDAELSIGNSAGVLAFEGARSDWVRPGIMLYGVSPFAGSCGADHGLRPAMTLCTRLLGVKRVAANRPVGYGGRYLSAESMLVGAAAIGYADGLPRNAPNGTQVLVNAMQVPVAGRVSMDTITLDLRGVPDARCGDPVTVWGPDLPLERMAGACDTIGYELLVRVGSRVPRRAA